MPHRVFFIVATLSLFYLRSAAADPPEDIRAFRQDGKFPDGAVLVKDITNVASEKLTTGQSSWSTDIKIWFVMFKYS